MNRLKLDYLHHPRRAPEPARDWDLERGFRIRVEGERLVVLTLGPGGPPLAREPQEQEESLVLVLAGSNPRASDLAAAVELPASEGWEPGAVLVLSDDLNLAWPATAIRRELASVADRWLVVWVLQEMPPGDYFNAEEVLHQLGRISRRIRRRCRWRRKLPW